MKVPKIIIGFVRETLQFDMKTLPKLNASKIICFVGWNQKRQAPKMCQSIFCLNKKCLSEYIEASLACTKMNIPDIYIYCTRKFMHTIFFYTFWGWYVNVGVTLYILS